MRIRRALFASTTLALAAYPLGCGSDPTDGSPSGGGGLGGAGGGAMTGGAAGTGGVAGRGAAGASGQGGAAGAAGESGASGASGGGAAGAAGVGGAGGPTFTNPVHDVDFPDPFVLFEGGTYYAFATNAAGRHVQAARSADLATWEDLPDALPELPAWAAPNGTLTWAPAVLKRGARFVLFFTTRHQASNFQCVGSATSLVPEGPYDASESTEALVCQVSPPTFCGSIDPEPFYDAAADKTYLLWKSDDNAPQCNRDARLWAQELSEVAVDFAAGSTPVELLKRDQDWELPLIENPSMLFAGGVYYLFYSANWWESAAYAVGFAECPDGPRAPCAKKTTAAGPLFASSAEALGPGGASLFVDAAQRRFMAYHAWTAPAVGYGSGGARSLRIEPVSFVSGAPVVAGPTTTPQPLPGLLPP